MIYYLFNKHEIEINIIITNNLNILYEIRIKCKHQYIKFNNEIETNITQMQVHDSNIVS